VTLRRRARLGSLAAHRRQNVEERHVVRQDGRDVDDVLEVAPERQLRRTRNEPHDRLDRKPRRTRRLYKEENVQETGDSAQHWRASGKDHELTRSWLTRSYNEKRAACPPVKEETDSRDYLNEEENVDKTE